MNFIDGYLNRKFKKVRLEKYLKEKNEQYKQKLAMENILNNKDGVLK